MRTIIGIDPGSRTGLAFIRDGKLAKCYTASMDDLNLGLAIVALFGGPENVLVVIEEPPKGIFPRPGQNARAMMRIARNVGQCQARADEIARRAREIGCEVRMMPPIRGGTKRKVTPEAWRAMFPEWTGRTPSNHARDSAMLARRAAVMEKIQEGAK
jgi:hypothetical protein